MFRIAQISDTHLSADKPFFVENFERTIEAVADAAVDLVVNTGDISLDGAGAEAELAAAAELHRQIAVPLRTLPGNHDIGDNADVPAPPGHADHAVTAERRQRYLRQFGADWWCLDVPGWRLVGCNSLLFGSGLPEELEQAVFLRNATEGAGSRRLALFGHKPVCDRALDESEIGGRFLNPDARAALLDCLAAPVAVMACGHVHQFRDAMVGGTRHVWAPSTGFVLPDFIQPRYGVKRVGWVEHRFHPDGQYACALMDVADASLLQITDFPGAYGAFWDERGGRRSPALVLPAAHDSAQSSL
ncbi:MAG: metallophosphoesterase [Reyranellaceae bacterium]